MSRKRDVDAYIAKSGEFARPILEKLRRSFHKASPNIEETIKWGVPQFEHEGIVGGMAAFKHHVTLHFWKGKLLKDAGKLLSGVGRTSMRTIKLEKLSDLPSERVLVGYIKEAVRLNEAGAKTTNKRKAESRDGKSPRATKKVTAPKDLMAALKKSRKALATFEKFSTSNRREYVEWVTDAKQAATRTRRIATAIEWMAEGRPRNWKYMKKW